MLKIDGAFYGSHWRYKPKEYVGQCCECGNKNVVVTRGCFGNYWCLFCESKLIKQVLLEFTHCKCGFTDDCQYCVQRFQTKKKVGLR